MKPIRGKRGASTDLLRDRISDYLSSADRRRPAATALLAAFASRCAIVILVATGLGASLAGCESAKTTGVESAPPAPTAPGAVTESVYYTGADNVPLYQDPGANLIANLPMHTKVLRDRLQRGYAHVRVEATGQQGWLDNSKLIWRLPPAAPAAQTVAPSSPPPEPPESPSPRAVQTEEAPRTTTAPRATQSPSIFNPF